MENESGGRLTEDQLKTVIARAIELDARVSTTSAEELRSIAREVGISPEAVNAALAEHERSVDLVVDQGATRSALRIIATGIPLGIAAGALMGFSSSLFAPVGALGLVGAGFVASGALLVVQGRNATMRFFHQTNFLLWSGIATAGAITVALVGTGPFALPIVFVTWGVRGWISSSILGSAAVIAIRRATKSQETPGGRAEGGTGAIRTRVLGVARRLGDLLSNILRRERLATSHSAISHVAQEEGASA